jgi:hypothetical protein
MNIIYNEDQYVEYEVDGMVWGYVCEDVDIRPSSDAPMSVFLLQDRERIPYAYWAWVN